MVIFRGILTMRSIDLLVLFHLPLCILALNDMDKNNYGPYAFSWQKIEACKGPKQGSCGKFEVENIKNTSDIIFVMDFTKDCPVTTARVTISSYQNNKTMKKLWNYSLSKPCQHFVLGPILLESFNLTSNHCVIDAGRYKIHLNFKQKARMFLGSNFFYGTYAFKTFAYNKVDNFFCVDTIVDIKKNT